MKITGIAITHHRLPLDPPFHAAWDSVPRRHFDSTIVRAHQQAANGKGGPRIRRWGVPEAD